VSSFADSALIGFVLSGISGCCLQSTIGTTGATSNSSATGGTSSGGSSSTSGDGGTGCTIDGQIHAKRAENPANAAECCNPDLSETNWQPLFTKVFTYPFPMGNVAFGATIADLNHDGSDDVVAVVLLYKSGGPQPVPGTSPIWIFLSSDGGFAAPVQIGNPQEIGGDVAVGDLNRDGRADVVFDTEQNVYVALNEGDGQFQVGDPTSSNGCQPAGLAMDPAHDDWLDVVMGTLPAVGCGLFVLRNDRTGDGALLAPQILTDQPLGEQLLSPMVGDFTGDGRSDIAYQAYDNFGVSLWWMANVDGGFASPKALLDAGGDNVPVVTTFSTSSGTALGFSYVNNLSILLPVAGEPTLATTENIDGGCWGLAAADFDGDGLSDFVCGAQGTLDILRGETATTWISGATIPVPSPEQILWVGTGDLNGDGAADVVLLRWDFPSSASWEGWINTCGAGAAKLIRDGGLSN
jgi:hypothetical protein